MNERGAGDNVDSSFYRSFRDLDSDGLVPFSLAPVYAYSGVSESIIDKFAGEGVEGRPKDFRVGRIKFDRLPVAYCQEYGRFLEIMDKTAYLYFKQWFLSNNFASRGDGSRRSEKYFELRHWMARVLDPLALEASSARVPVSLELYTLSGFRALMRPSRPIASSAEASKKIAGETIMLETVPPEEDVIVRGKAALSLMREA